MPPTLQVVQFRCAAPGCGATWRILPKFLARQLWRAWPTIERVVKPDGLATVPRDTPPVPAKDSAPLVVADRGGRARARRAAGRERRPNARATAARVGLDATRAELVAAHAEAGVAAGARLAAVAALAHRLERGLRLM